MHTLDIRGDILLPDGTFELVNRANGMVRLRNTLTREVVERTETELFRDNVRFPSMQLAVIRNIDSASTGQANIVQFWCGHLDEVLTGAPQNGSAPRSSYDPACTKQEERVQLKLIELEQAHMKTSRSTLMRKLSAYRKGGPSSLIDGRATRTFAPLENADPRLVEALSDAIAAQALKSTITKAQVLNLAIATLVKQFGADGPPLPSQSTLYTYLEALGGGRYLTKSAKTRASMASRPNRTFRKNTTSFPGAEVQVDSTTLDVFITGPSGKKERPILTVLIDVASRSILAHTLSLAGSKGIDHVLLLAQALTRPSERPNKDEYRAELQAQHPGTTLLSPEEHARAASRRRHIYPRRIVMDNGTDYLSKVFESALCTFGIDVTFSPPHTPTTKPFVERGFSSISTLLLQHLSAYVGRSAEHRGRGVENEKALNIFVLNEVIEDWIISVWQERPHNGLYQRSNPGLTHSPNMHLEMAAELTGTIDFSISEEQFIRLLPSKFVVISEIGVRVNNRHYDSAALHPLRNSRSNLPNKSYYWDVKYDPYRPHQVWVVGRDNELILCTDRDQLTSFSPVMPTPAELRTEERAHVVGTHAALIGIPLHQPPVVEDIPTFDFDTEDEDAAAFPEFNIEGDH